MAGKIKQKRSRAGKAIFAKLKSRPRAARATKAKKTPRYVYYFGDGQADGAGTMKPLLGGKGANLAEMTRIGLPVPPGFTITTEVCTYYYENKRSYPPQLEEQVTTALAKVEKSVNKKLGDRERPLLVSVRSGARDSMPGMMDTILNLGMNDEVVEIVAKKSGNARFAWDSYRRFLQMYGDVVMGVQTRVGEDHEPFESVIEHLKDERYGNHHFPDVQLTVEDLKMLVQRFKALIKERTGKSFPQDPKMQLWGAIGAVFGSWNNDRAIVYRRKYRIPHEWGTAVNVQTMVFGNMGNTSATGVAFTRDPASGEEVFYGEYLINAQGEDVVAGVRTPHPIADLAKEMPEAHKALMKVRALLEKHFKDMQDLEFTVEDNRLYILQTRNGKRTGHAAVRIAVDMVGEKLISRKDAVKRIPADSLAHLLAPIFDRKSASAAKKIGSGLAAGPGAASGHVVFSATEAVRRAEKGEKVILARIETSPEDLRGMIAAEGILTSRGGVSSHAALVARQMGKVCVCGALGIRIDYQKRTLSANGTTLNQGDYISIDGSTGEVFAGEVSTAPSEIVQVLVDQSLDGKKSATYQQYAKLMKWVDEFRKLDVRTNADTPEQVTNAVAFGAQGVGLCRTEHMFFEGDRIDAMREMILADNTEDRAKALGKLLPYQREDFVGIFKALKGLPATIRFLDPPLHEFLPHEDSQQMELAQKLGVKVETISRRVRELHEFNPMLGHRGCRLGIVYPEISEMQARAVFEAAAAVQKRGGKVRPEIMIPLVGFPRELKLQIDIVHRVAADV
ncbi:MAG: pyruvate, phosphate dikinase, partial [Verrucomicrobiota bacterium]|nr:pyruvate, phosphate dikinase [Verrucomicrobiota bacterium]